MKKSITSVCVLSLFAATSAIAAGSVRIGGGSLKTAQMSEQSVSTTDTARMALSKSSSSLSKKLSDVIKVKETQSSKPLPTNSDIRELESRMTSRMNDLETAISDINDELVDIVEEIQKLSAGSGSAASYVCAVGCSLHMTTIADGSEAGVHVELVCLDDKTGKRCEGHVFVDDHEVVHE